jgi:spore maturation protein CgeB
MKFVLFYHSFVSCWNHGNAHFLRGFTRELIRLGHEVAVYEPLDGWSRTNALADGAGTTFAEARALVPGVVVREYVSGCLDLDQATDGADVVIAHEWNPPVLIGALGQHRISGASYALLFHDTHHRVASAPGEIGALELDGFDAVLAFGEALREAYLHLGWARRVFTWHEAADTALFHPMPSQDKDTDLVWIGNWGDGERTVELESFLINPASRLGLRARIHGVRYPDKVRDALGARGISYAGWLPNHRAPAAFSRSRLTVHVPRRAYTAALPGIPTIRVFEALACGIPLACAPWRDEEGLFPAGSYLTAASEEAMTAALSAILRDPDLSHDLVTTGLRAIRERHTCAHRALELVSIIRSLNRSCGSEQPNPHMIEQRAAVS